MKSNYGIFNHHDLNNELLILFSDRNVTHEEKSGEVVCLYNDDEIVGYKIDNFIRYAKIKYSGIIFYPNHILIDVINSVLANSKVETLSYMNNSGYFIKKNGNHFGVYAEKGTFLRNKKKSLGRFCTYYDLYIENESPNSLIEIIEDNLDNKDFFESKEY